LSRPLRGREMQGGKPGRYHTIHLLRERLCQIAGTQPGLDVADRNTTIERGQSATQRGCSITLDKYDIGRFLLKDRFQSSQNSRGRLFKTLTGQHQIQFVIRFYLEDIQNLVQQFSMLSGRAGPHLKTRTVAEV